MRGADFRMCEIANRLNGFQPDFPFLLGTGFANPDHAAEVGAVASLFEDEFDDLSAPELETSTQPEPSFRGIKDKAWESLRLAVQIDNQAGPLLQHDTVRATGFVERKAGPFLNHWSRGSDSTPVIVSLE